MQTSIASVCVLIRWRASHTSERANKQANVEEARMFTPTEVEILPSSGSPYLGRPFDCILDRLINYCVAYSDRFTANASLRSLRKDDLGRL